MTDARLLVDEIRAKLAPVTQKVAQHPYVIALEEGLIERGNLRVIAGEQYTIISSDLRSIAGLVGRHGHLPSRKYLLELLQGEATAGDALLSFAKALDMCEQDLRAYEPIAECQAYPAYVSWLASYGSDAAFAAAFLVNLPAWGANCRRISKALQVRYLLPNEAVAFFEGFAASPPTFEEESLAVIQTGLDRGAEPADIRRAARMLQSFELLYWDALHFASS